MQFLIDIWNSGEIWLTAHIFAPLVAGLGVGAIIDDPRDIAQYLMIACAQVLIIGCVFRPLESIAPIEEWTDRGRTNIDRFYTILKELGLVPLFTFGILLPLSALGEHLLGGGSGGEAKSLPDWIPWFADKPLLVFGIYFAAFDLTAYIIHRLQHALPWWWAMHSLHHSQTHVNCWTDDRNHMIDDCLEALIQGAVAVAIGVPAGQYALLILIGRLIENFSHANVRFYYGRFIDKLFVDPKFHRLHHMKADPAEPDLHNCNFALVLPIWDILFRTALYGRDVRPCGVDDPAIDKDNELSWWGQQVAVFKRLMKALKRTPMPDQMGRREPAE